VEMEGRAQQPPLADAAPRGQREIGPDGAVEGHRGQRAAPEQPRDDGEGLARADVDSTERIGVAGHDHAEAGAGTGRGEADVDTENGGAEDGRAGQERGYSSGNDRMMASSRMTRCSSPPM
jgi:hypothetical protein